MKKLPEKKAVAKKAAKKIVPQVLELDLVVIVEMCCVKALYENDISQSAYVWQIDKSWNANDENRVPNVDSWEHIVKSANEAAQRVGIDVTIDACAVAESMNWDDEDYINRLSKLVQRKAALGVADYARMKQIENALARLRRDVAEEPAESFRSRTSHKSWEDGIYDIEAQIADLRSTLEDIAEAAKPKWE
jgi:hypothetical protein